MRTMMLAPMALLLGSTAAPSPSAPAFKPGWCGDSLDPAARPAILAGYGAGGFAIRTGNPEAQAFFNNGMQLAHAFAHKAAIAAFQEARRLDPECAMCAWGEAWSSGPTINYGVDGDEALRKLAEITDTAERLAEGGPARERNLIGALKQRHRKGGNAAFADAMDRMAKLAPQDDAIAVLAADALMIAAPDWDAATMTRPVALLEGVLARTPDYAPAIHFYIHATEGARYPERAVAFADRLKTLAPAASHLVHMPSHTYYWVGRYADAATANVAAVEIGLQNAKRLGLAEPDGVWTLAYHGHNVHFGIGGALMSGDGDSGLKLARPLIAMSGRSGTLHPFRQLVLGEAFVAVARFGAPQEMLAIPDPGKANPAARALWHYARGEAFARIGDIDAMLREGRAMPSRLKDDKMKVGAPLLAVSRLVLEGRAAMLRGRHLEAAAAFAKAAAIEEAKPLADFADPPLWWYPVRRDVAAALLASGDAKGALDAANASLERRPLDPVALDIRAQAQEKLGNAPAAARDRALARKGWRGDAAAIG